ncbi:Rhamnogalacturonyl hydrolase YesR [Spirosomataceae bacterium TFI 002]|nr:Rhamnogalacturonyl hydrolase YesR [Spirosomataceae bacterium TFI 002]
MNIFLRKSSLLLLIPFVILQSCSTKAPSSSSKSNEIETAMVKAMQWQEQNEKYGKGPTDWTNGAYYTGVMRAHKATSNPLFEKAMIDMGKRNEWKTHDRFFHADDIVISAAYLHLKNLGNKEVNLDATDKWIHEHLYEPQDWKVGKGNAEQKILWWWCDALFMAPPVLVTYSNMKNDTKYLDEMHKYYMESYNYLFDKDESLFYRDNRFFIKGEATDRREPNGEKIFWSRGNGWVLAGLALILDDMPKSYEHRPFYVNLYKTMAARIKELQPEDGLWRTSLLNPDGFEYGEASGSGFYTFALAWGLNNGILDKKAYQPTVDKAWKALAQCQQENGKVGWVQTIGYDPKPADKDSWFNFGTGAFLLAGSEMIKMK